MAGQWRWRNSGMMEPNGGYVSIVARACLPLIGVLLSILLLAPGSYVVGQDFSAGNSRGGVQSPNPSANTTFSFPNQNPPPASIPSPNPWTQESLESRIAQLQVNTELDTKIRDALLELYRQILAEVKALAESEKTRKDWTSAAEQAPLAIAAARERLQVAKESAERVAKIIPGANLSLGIELAELERQLQTLQSELQNASSQKSKAEQTINQRDNRRKDLPTLLATLREKFDSLEREKPIAPNDPVDPLVKEALTVLQRLQRERLIIDIAAIEQEQRAYDAETELWPLKRDEAQQKVTELTAEIQRLAEIINKRRKLGIELSMAEAKLLRENSPEILHPLADSLLARSTKWLELTRKRAALQGELAGSKSDFEQLNDRFQKMQSRIKPQGGNDLGGFNSWLGLILREQRGELPEPNRLRSQISKHQNEMQIADALLFELEDRLETLAAVERDRNLIFSEIGGQPEEVTDEVVSKTTEILDKESKLLSGMRAEADGYYNDLLQLADSKERLARLGEQYRNFIDQHILWIRSSETLDKSDFVNAWQAFKYFVDFKNWGLVYDYLWGDLRSQPWQYFGLLGLVIALLLYQSVMRRKLFAASEQVGRRANVSFYPTLIAVILTVLIALPFPLLLLFLGYRLKLANFDNYFVVSLGEGLLAGGRFLASLELLRQICRPHGLAISHLQWPKGATDLLRINLRWWLDLGIPLVIAIVFFDEMAGTRRDESIGRMLFILLMFLLSIFLARVFRLSNGVLSTYLTNHQGGWADRLKYVWYPLMVIVPLVMAGLSFIGFHYTAERITLSLHTTMWTLIGLVVVHGLLMRWLLLSRRKLVIHQARMRLEEVTRKDSPSLASSSVDEEAMDIAAINAQTQRLVTSCLFVCGIVGLAIIWKGVLPALTLLEGVPLWTVEGATPNDRVAITLANIVISIPVIVLTIIASRNLPGLMEIALLQNLPLDKAMRYAITSITSYAILLLGMIFVLSSLGLRWSSIQWLVAALGVGLGFGLQEIFANFICGIIVLFEQPIRVGDVITIGDTTGVVSKIRMRSTTIVNWDRKELIVPNKDLITGRILNWTLSDGTNRLVVQVGVAYGTDTELAVRLVQEIVRKHPNILRDPEPTVTFEGFADSSLTICIRAFVADVAARLPTTHDLHTQIYRSFAEHGIEIPFGQRDLHIRSLPPELFQGNFSNRR